jgi:hypothetical protein
MTVYMRGVTAVGIATTKNLNDKSKVFAQWQTHKYTWSSPDGEAQNWPNHISICRRSMFQRSQITEVRKRLSESKFAAQTVR